MNNPHEEATPEWRCVCGAQTEDGSPLCRKCQARSRWQRRNKGRHRRDTRRPAGRKNSSRPATRRRGR
jgi:hypothetical protein